MKFDLKFAKTRWIISYTQLFFWDINFMESLCIYIHVWMLLLTCFLFLQYEEVSSENLLSVRKVIHWHCNIMREVTLLYDLMQQCLGAPYTLGVFFLWIIVANWVVIVCTHSVHCTYRNYLFREFWLSVIENDDRHKTIGSG